MGKSRKTKKGKRRKAVHLKSGEKKRKTEKGQEKRIETDSLRKDFRLVPLWKSRRKSLLFIFILTFLVRFIYVVELSAKSPFFDNPVVDADAYYSAAKYIAKTGDWLGEGHTYNISISEELITPEMAYWVERPYWQAPLYFYFLAFVFKLFGISFWLILILQSLLSAVSGVFVYAVAVYFFSHRVAFFSGFVFSLYGTLIFFSGELLVPAFLIFLILLMFYFLLIAFETKKLNHWILFGLFFSLGLIARSTLIVFLPAVLFWILYKRFKTKELGAVVQPIAILLITCFFFPVLTWVRNMAITGENVLVSTNSGINFYIGNNENWLETYKIRPGHQWNVLVREPLKAENSWTLNHSRQNSHFLQKTTSWILKNPGKFLTGLLEKTYFHFHGYELIRNVDLYHLSRYSVLLSILLWYVPFLHFPAGLLIPLFLISFIFLFQKNWRKYFLLTSFLILTSFVIVVFFPTSRYRIQFIPFFIMVAVFGVEKFILLVKEKKWKKVAPAAGIFVVLFVVLNLSNISRTFESPVFTATNYYMEGVVYYKQQNYEKAIDLFQKTISIDPGHEDALTNLGLCYAFMDKSEEAGRYFLLAYQENPEFPKNIFNLGIYYQKSDQWKKAMATFEEYIRKEQEQKIDYFLYQRGVQEYERCKARVKK